MDRQRPFKIDYVRTSETKNDWEEINFEFNSAILSDGFPTLLWLADFLKGNPGYRVKVEGNTDYVGSDQYNLRLGQARADSVKQFLVKYGAPGDAIQTANQGKRRPEVSNGTKEGRFVNRRVTITVTDNAGKTMSLEDLINSKYKAPVAAAAKPDCCDEILKRLDKLDQILGELQGMKSAHDALKNEVDNLKGQMAGLPTKKDTENIARAQGDITAERAVEEAQRRNKKFSLLALNIGPTLGNRNSGDFTFSGKGRFFSPFGGDGRRAVQAEAEYMYYPERQEGQFDIGLVNRWSNVQMGLFSSFKYVNFRNIPLFTGPLGVSSPSPDGTGTMFTSAVNPLAHGGGSLGQGAFALDYLFSRGKIGIFGTKGFKDNAVINRAQLGTASSIETYLRIVDQVGGSTQIGMWGDSYIEGNLAYLRGHRGHENRPGGMIRFVQPLSEHFGVSVEAGLNETFLQPKNSGRLVFGFLFGNWLRPKEYTEVTHPVPMDIPRIRYELLTRRVGSSPPVADAGPDQIGVPSGLIQLEGSRSYSPDGDPLTFRWEQVGGPGVSLSGANTARPNFTSADGQTYIFQLTVANPAGLRSSARTTVTTARTAVLPAVRFLQCQATPTNIMSGEVATLSWDTENAQQVTISGIGTVRTSGTATVSPTQTTTYTLTATSPAGPVSCTATVKVGSAAVRILVFTAQPPEILPTEQSTLVWQVEGSNDVSISPSIGKVAPTGNSTVSPTDTTTYTITARSPQGDVNATATVTVIKPVKILNFVANPPTVAPGQPVVLTCTTQNAIDVSITGVGTVPASGSVTVNPTVDTSYSCIATGRRSQTTALVLVRVTTQSARGPVCDAGPNIRTNSNNTQLDATRSFSPDQLPLTYSFSFVNGPGTATVSNASTASPTVKMPLYGDYVFQLTVTDSKGGKCTAFTRVTFADP